MDSVIHRIAREAGLSRARSGRLRRRLAESPRWQALIAPARTDHGARRVRARVIAEVRAELAPRTDTSTLQRAVHTAVLLDEVSLLPPRQRYALWSAAIEGRPAADIARRTGWTASQVHRLLGSALTTVTVRAQRW
ncbi:hypothetical protein CFN78_21210 [Amycolatopsis antarctica]|uniref:RNA polymerase sigma factor 70 region 4 type 2 domain-containing protein n=2 Tax=Amycolatopsis antarctica TaxID=1854586 RepID=A0A263CYQ9_9PSEU|nr:hypothetical protein CFN78_21210 [Amycolatopsis antarctica]